ncbi:MAG: SUMF1/EgtB/PvdO family nonheme iron enzyme [Polyangiaceae bacterium]
MKRAATWVQLDKWRRAVVFLAVLAVSVATACGGEESDSAAVCQRGATQTCVTSTCAGTQVCEGDRWGTCECSSGTGGVGGAGGVSGSGSADAGIGGQGGQPGPSCPGGLSGPKLVLVRSAAGQDYCIDSTEVTQVQYQEFLASKPPTSTQSAACAWNATYVPAFIPNAACDYEGTTFDPAKTPHHPVACVDWCDADTYCRWAGKRLCGQIGGGALDPSKVASAADSEWFNACSHQGQLVFPYGNTFDPARCNDDAIPIDPSPLPATQSPLCEGGFPGLFQMSGDLTEWENGCDASLGEFDQCPNRGGPVGLGKDYQRCDVPGTAARSLASSAVGIRCCADVL